MTRFILLTIFICSILSSCKQGYRNELSGGADKKFEQLSEEFLSQYLAWRPGLAVYLGFHDYDGKTPDVSKLSIERELSRLKNYDKMLDEFDTSSLSQHMFYDFRLLHLAIENEIFSFEEMESFTDNPITYAGAMDVSIYINRKFASLEDRLKSIISIEKDAHRFYSVAHSNLRDSLPKPYIEIAIQISRGTSDFLGKDLITALKEVKNDSLMTVFKVSNDSAISEVNAFADYLEKEKLPKANNNFAIGREKYRKMLLYGEAISVSPERILEIGMKNIAMEDSVFNSMAAIINPGKKAQEVYADIKKEHPSEKTLIHDVKKNVENIRQFLIAKKIISLPANVNLQVQETPEYARSTSTASMNAPGPFEVKASEAYYYITPVDPGWTRKQKEDWLAMFDTYTTDITTIHEAYPGHYTQGLHLNASSATKLEKIFMSYAFIEGWAHYTEKMMLDEGYGNNGDPIVAAKYRMAQSGESLLRLCRLCVSIKMHCQGMSIDEATKFFMEHWHQGEKPSRQEAIRGAFDPGYLNYTLGKLEILKLREDYKKQEGANFNLQKFHDILLENGGPPIRFLREILLKDKKTWSEIL